MKPHFCSAFGLGIVLFALVAPGAEAGSATWKLNPPSGSWIIATNWTPTTVPDGPTDVATFGQTNFGSITNMSATVGTITFVADANTYSFTIDNGTHTIAGAGITNDAGRHTFTVREGAAGGTAAELSFTNSATVGSGMQFNANASNDPARPGGIISFHDTASAGESNYSAFGLTVPNGENGVLSFEGSSTAGLASFFAGGTIFFRDNSSAGDGYFEVAGAESSTLPAGLLSLDDSADGASAIVINYAGDVSGSKGGATWITGSATAGNASIFANSGVGGGGSVIFAADSDTAGGTATIQLNGKGELDISSSANSAMTTIGSLSGDGLVFLGSHTLGVGSNNMDRSFTGTMADGGIDGGTGGALAKVGTGTLTLYGANTYTGGTLVEDGVLLVNYTSASTTGPGPVQVAGGVLGGFGVIAGPVTIGDGVGSKASLAPGQHIRSPLTLTVQSSLTFASDSRYLAIFQVHEPKYRSDMVNANGVTIMDGASFQLRGRGQGTLVAGTVLTVINNTSAQPIVGTFRNLPDGGLISAHGITFRANYEGGSGNDLTLTVQP